MNALFTADYDARTSALQASGVKLPEGERESWIAAATDLTKSSIDLTRAEFRVIYRKGKAVAPSGVEEGFGVLTAAPHPIESIPLPADPEAGKLDVIEFRVPMTKQPMRGSGTNVLLGLQFAWNEAAKTWVPWRNAVYHDPNAVYTIVPY